MHVTLGAGPVTEEADRRFARLTVADLAVQPLPHCIAGGVQALAAHHDAVELEAGPDRIPGALVDTAEDAEQFGRVHPAAPGDAVLAVGREGHVLRGHRATGTDLRGLLPQQRGPQTELALPLQGVGFPVGPADEHHVAIQRLDFRCGDLQVELRMRDSLPLGSQHLDEVFTFAGGAEAGDHLLRTVRPVELHRGADNRAHCGASNCRVSDRFGSRSGVGWCALARRHGHLLAVTPRSTCDGYVGDAATQRYSCRGSHCQESTLPITPSAILARAAAIVTQ